jgi:hypothetical protein
MNSRYPEIGDFQDSFSTFLDAENIARLEVAVATFKLLVEFVKSLSKAQHLLQRPQNKLLRKLWWLLLLGLPIILKVSTSRPWKDYVPPFLALVNTG